jgi:pyruvate/2-oxoglutarate dehydrogenase complex dihydrolipoamide dehydrogenase (E3) component
MQAASAETYNIIVIGAGSAGLTVAAGAAGLGARVALVERERMGGDCLNTGCVPSKALIRAAKTAHTLRRGGQGIPAAGAPSIDWAAVAGHVQSVIDTIAPHDSVERFTALGVDVWLGQARLSGQDRVSVTDPAGQTHTLRGKAIVLATGSRAAVPPIPGLAEAGFQTNETVFTMPSLPSSLAVIGGGPIGCELGQALARLGAQVTLLEMARLLPKDDPDAAQVVAAAMAADGVALRTGVQVRRVERAAGRKRIVFAPAGAEAGRDEQHVDVDEILLAVGRQPNVAELGLEAVGVRTHRGGIAVDERLRTHVPGIFACGDVAGPLLFTHTANQQARVVIQNALFPIKARMDYRVVPWATFTDPELAQVGLHEEEARANRIPFRTIHIPFAGVDRMVCDDARAGFLKVLTPPGRDDILGATMVGAHAGELIHELVLAMQAKLRLRDLAGTIHAYPTMAEIFRRAGDESRKASLTPRLQRLIAAYLRWRRR